MTNADPPAATSLHPTSFLIKPATTDIQPLPSSPITTKLNLMDNNTDLHLPDLPIPSPYIRSLVIDFGLVDPLSLVHLYADTTTHGCCSYCGIPLKQYDPAQRRWIPLEDPALPQITYDHLLPAAYGCPSLTGALLLACSTCNSSKADLPYDQWILTNPSTQRYNNLDPADHIKFLDDNFLKVFWTRTPTFLRDLLTNHRKPSPYDLGDFIRLLVDWRTNHPTDPPFTTGQILQDLHWWPAAAESLYSQRSLQSPDNHYPTDLIYGLLEAHSHNSESPTTPPTTGELTRQIFDLLESAPSYLKTRRSLALALDCIKDGFGSPDLPSHWMETRLPAISPIPRFSDVILDVLPPEEPKDFGVILHTLTQLTGNPPLGWTDDIAKLAVTWCSLLDSIPVSHANDHRISPRTTIESTGTDMTPLPDDFVHSLSGTLPRWMESFCSQYLTLQKDSTQPSLTNLRVLFRRMIPGLVLSGDHELLSPDSNYEVADTTSDPVVRVLLCLIRQEFYDKNGRPKDLPKSKTAKQRRRSLETALAILAPETWVRLTLVDLW